MSGIQNLVTHWLKIIKKMRNEKIFLAFIRLKIQLK